MNLYFTDPTSNKQTNLSFQHTCLYISAVIDQENNEQQIISFCLTQLSTPWITTDSHLNEPFTFAELHEQQITAEQLYLWSTPIDIIEHYQSFLTQLPTSLQTPMATELFHNCTLPLFGPSCQYELDNYHSAYSSLSEMINDYYLHHPYKPKTLTCYLHLQCDRGPSPACLDWSEICDGKIDCLNNGIDEELCWKLEINQCAKDQYRCSNGQCIPFVFFRDNHHLPDCLDGSDEIQNDDQSQDDCSIALPTFACEDVTCTIYRSTESYQYRTLLTSSCERERNHLLAQALFPNRSQSLTQDCWFAFKCIVHMPIPQDPICRQLCQKGVCDKMIENNCPDILFMPDVPVLFGHIYFAYTKNHFKYSDRTDSPPRYLCFKNDFCNELLQNKEFFIFNQTKCIRPQDLSLVFSAFTGRTWLNKYISTTSQPLSRCNSIINKDSNLCNKPNMYRCMNSSKCISIHRLIDGVFDCDHYDDENTIMFNDTLSSKVIRTHFKCSKMNKYISYRLVQNGQCDCNAIDNESCEDENFDIDFITNHISFQTICDGFVELNSIIIDGHNHTDETECEQWFCDNQYTHCDGIWHCLDGSDEVNCSFSLSSSFLTCPSSHHICISNQTKQFHCLPIEKANDGLIDCLGGIDEPKLCRSDDYKHVLENFYCLNDNRPTCISRYNLCDDYKNCDDSVDEQVCDTSRNVSIYGGICSEKYQSIRTDMENYLCHRLDEVNKQRIVYFSLDQRAQQSPKNTFLASDVRRTTPSSQHCHRGIVLRIWVDKKKNLSSFSCLCPPNFSGDQCEYQNPRISLTLQFRALSDSWQTPFLIVLLLIDHSYERIIHSYERLIYLSMKDCQRKFHHYLLYSNHHQNLSKNNYSIHIDIYEQISLVYRGSFLFPIHFSFLPVYRLALQLTISHHNPTVDLCSKHQCVHGRCMTCSQSDTSNQTFCQCQSGWSGQYCTIPYDCMCSPDSLCLGMSSLTNRSICLCPMNKFGSRCLLTHSFLSIIE